MRLYQAIPWDWGASINRKGFLSQGDLEMTPETADRGHIEPNLMKQPAKKIPVFPEA